MGIKNPTCLNCEWIKETKKHLCKFPNERGRKMNACTGREDYYPLWKEARDFVNKNYKSFR